jgi:hypothetical protein
MGGTAIDDSENHREKNLTELRCNIVCFIYDFGRTQETKCDFRIYRCSHFLFSFFHQHRRNGKPSEM